MSRSHSFAISAIDLTEVAEKYDHTIDTFCNVNFDSLNIGDIITTGTLCGPSSFTIDPAAYGDNTGTVLIAGNLQVDGTTTTINSTELTVEDKNIVLAAGSTSCTTSNGAGITVCLGTDGQATFTYNSTNDAWDMNKSLSTNLTGQVSDISNHFTCDLTECNSLYFTEARADARVCCVLETLTFEQVTDIDFTTNNPQTTANLVLQSKGNGCYCFADASGSSSLCDLTDNIDFTASQTSGNVLTSDGDGTFSFQETDTFGAIIYSLALG